MEEQKKDKASPMGARITLAMMLPGAGQLANKQPVKGVITIAVSALLFVDIIVHVFIIALPLLGAWMGGMEVVIDEKTTDPLGTLLIVCAIAIAIWVWSLVDTIIVARRQLSGGPKP